MTIENCPNCGGMHFGVVQCPYTPEQGRAFRVAAIPEPPPAEPPHDDRIEFPSGGPCSACGDGDTKQEYHKHVAPAPSEEPLEHGRNCPGRIPLGDDCTCGLKYRIESQNWYELYMAWRKRAEEAEKRESSPVNLKDTARKWLEENASKFWKRWPENKSGTEFDTVAALAAFAAHMREGK